MFCIDLTLLGVYIELHGIDGDLKYKMISKVLVSISSYIHNILTRAKFTCGGFWKTELAVGSELNQRRIKHGVVCIACGRDEDLMHRFWTCPFAAEYWLKLHCLIGQLDRPPKQITSQAELRWWLLDWLGKNSGRDSAYLMMHLYQIWLARNDASEATQIEDPRGVARRTVATIEEWNNVHQPAPPRAAVPAEHCLSPGEG